MTRRPALFLVFALTATACAGGSPLDELIEQVRLDDPMSETTYQENRETIEVAESIPMLVEHLANDEAPKVRQYCALILGRIGDAEAVPALTAALGDGDAGVRGRAVAALQNIGEMEAEDAFIEALGNDSSEAQITVLVELERAQSVKAVPAIVALAKTNDDLISKNAIDTLGGIGDVAAVQPLVDMALDTMMAETLRHAAILNLGRIEAPEASAGIQQVIAALTDEPGAEELLAYAREQG